MRFAIKTVPQHTTWSAMLDVWRAADEIELFESAWNFDHFYPIFGNTDHTGPCLEAWSTLAAMAQATQRIRVGCQVTGMIYRHPAVLANMAATVDIIPTVGSSSVSAPAGTRRSATPTASPCRRSRSASTASTRGSRRSSDC